MVLKTSAMSEKDSGAIAEQSFKDIAQNKRSALAFVTLQNKMTHKEAWHAVANFSAERSGTEIFVAAKVPCCRCVTSLHTTEQQNQNPLAHDRATKPKTTIILNY